ncbi:hypothetical protein AAFF_G00358960 [Aldrovandia affinis]|uniref:Uncharacterized protein n=1 Tax=Aldrovandia affinis TaxID=143900 RepID=A0AAD7SHY4_9TELE|nr:hypothetical protein AAFF_G00358960 [Aldrovandia affinis]
MTAAARRLARAAFQYSARGECAARSSGALTRGDCADAALLTDSGATWRGQSLEKLIYKHTWAHHTWHTACHRVEEDGTQPGPGSTDKTQLRESSIKMQGEQRLRISTPICLEGKCVQERGWFRCCLSVFADANIWDGESDAAAGADGPPVCTRAGSVLAVPSRALKHARLFPQPGQMAPLLGAREAVN